MLVVRFSRLIISGTRAQNRPATPPGLMEREKMPGPRRIRREFDNRRTTGRASVRGSAACFRPNGNSPDVRPRWFWKEVQADGTLSGQPDSGGESGSRQADEWDWAHLPPAKYAAFYV